VRPVPRMRAVVALLAAALSLSLAAASAAPAAQWVGLGDSYAAGPLIPNQSLNPLGSDARSATSRAAARRRRT